MSTDQKVQPALTAEQWAGTRTIEGIGPWYTAWCYRDGSVSVDVDWPGPRGEHDKSGLHAVAALCLNGQPFGFTREDVKFLTDEYLSLMTVKAGWPPSSHAMRLKSIIDRIEALLPPEST